jgi:hypothetical protein
MCSVKWHMKDGALMRGIDDDTPLRLAVLRVLMKWGSLPESDLSRMIYPHVLVTDDLREMAEEGYLDMAFIGDEFVLTPTTLGRLFLEQGEASEG